MKSATATARALTDEALTATALQLRREIPRMQQLFDALKREQRRRARAKTKAST